MTSFAEPLNVLFVVVHDLGDYLGCYGRVVETPNLDRLARDGMRFSNHFCSSPLCSPARGSLITGLYPHTNGLMGLVGGPGLWDLPPSNTSDADRFKQAGFDTYLVGHQNETIRTADLGFDYVAECVDLATVSDTAKQLLVDLGRRRSDGSAQPFYMRIGTAAVHRLYGRTGEFSHDPEATRYAYDWAHADGVPEPDVEVFPQWVDTPALREDLTGFTGEVKRLDAAIGEIVRTLEEVGLLEATIVVFVSDHGIDYPRAKATLFDLGTKTALILRAPGHRGVVSALTSHIDVLPTLLELCGIDQGLGPLQGESLAGLIKGTETLHRDAIFCEETSFPKNRMRCVRTDAFKLIRNIDTGRKSVAGICGPNPIEGSGDAYFVERPQLELYDLRTDPSELTNVADDPDYEKVKAELTARLESWMEDTDDPVLNGTENRPPGEMAVYESLPAMRRNEHFKLLFD